MWDGRDVWGLCCGRVGESGVEWNRRRGKGGVVLGDREGWRWCVGV